MRLIISGGGTGGHIFPAIAIADAIRAREPQADILFVGADGKMEMELVPKAGYKITGLPIRGFQRKFTWQNLMMPIRLLKSLWKAYILIKKHKPDVAIGVGGYASGPTLQVASWAGIPTMLQEQNSFAGATNRLLGSKATRIFVAYDHMEKFFPKEKIIFTGNPIRGQFTKTAIDKKAAREKLGLHPDYPTVFIFGGSLGAKTLNEALVKGFTGDVTPDKLNIIWQVGKLYKDQYASHALARHPNVKVFPFIDDMATVYAAADLVVCRAGALTISEIALLRKPAILVPSPNVAEDHQTANARALVEKNAALLVRDADAADQLVKTMITTVSDTALLATLSENIGYFAKPDAAVKIAEEILTYCSSHRR